jgi:hypothetical protein
VAVGKHFFLNCENLEKNAKNTKTDHVHRARKATIFIERINCSSNNFGVVGNLQTLMQFRGEKFRVKRFA